MNQNKQRRNILIMGVFIGIGLIFMKMFVDLGAFEIVAKVIGYIVIFFSVLGFVAFQPLKKLLKLQSKEEKKYEGKTKEEIYNLKEQDYKRQLQEKKWQYELEKKQHEINKLKSESNKSKESKMPDVLDNLKDFMK